MTAKIKQQRQAIIKAVADRIQQKLAGKQAELCEAFFRQLYANAALEDLKCYSLDDLYGSVVTLWHFYRKHESGEAKIQIYNPDYEKHGWQSTHTIIEILHADMPFLVDSTRMELDRLGLTTHMLAHIGGLQVKRDKLGRLTKFLPRTIESQSDDSEAVIYFEINRQTDPAKIAELTDNIQRVLKDVRLSVKDWQAMRVKTQESIADLAKVKTHLDTDDFVETTDFLNWIIEQHFTFLGIRDFKLVKNKTGQMLKPIPGSGLGILADENVTQTPLALSEMTPEAKKSTLSQQILIISKTGARATVHRPTYMDYIGIKQFDKQGNVIGERRVVGLYTSAAYNTNPQHIPFLRRKVITVIEQAHLTVHSHAGKALLNILETFPRDDLFQASTEELLEIALGIFSIQERRMIRLFTRKDIYGRFISCLVYVPKERFNTQLRLMIQEELAKCFHSQEVMFSPRFSDSILARIHFVFHLDPKQPVEYDVVELEQRIKEITRSWDDELVENILDIYGEEQGSELTQAYAQAFPVSYRDDFNPRTAVYDIKHMEMLNVENILNINFFRPVDAINGTWRLKVYQYNKTFPLSDALPILENMGMRVITESPYEIHLPDHCVWINDFGMEYEGEARFKLDTVKDDFQDAFMKICEHQAENDAFNKLVLAAGVDWREVVMLRAYAHYFKQTGFTFSRDYIAHTLMNHADITRDLVKLFNLRFKPVTNQHKVSQIAALEEHLYNSLEQVANLDEDRILRRYLDVIRATLRTNFFQADEQGQPKVYLSLKLNPHAIADLPLPLPMFEVFVYAPDFEGVHLRTSKVARGGLRWSDRREDFRTEVLGLMKAQQVKNAVIVPSGAKGGFFVKTPLEHASREEVIAAGIACYQNFIRGLLDITDNLQFGEVIKPKDVVCYDGEDYYFVVAADKGTATFSDIANEIAQEYYFWLGDAFASGGSAGYDHKKMGITARGAWESVKRHFRELGKNIQEEDFTVIGVGDMAGDVFGNGMLLSRHIKLVAAFNHMHIFLDPDPDAAVSFAERERLFHLPRSSWADYDPQLISKGGGVFERKAKSIKLTPQLKQLLDLDQDRIEPNHLIRAIFKAKVDLFWSGGIGTFVKAEDERNTDVGDKTNDAIRVNGNELRCKVVGEGGNLGLTQSARIEYALHGGLVYTDFIDNSAGVDCSDHEVNIKILLNELVTQGDMTHKQRNRLLADMTEEVAQLVLENNYKQTQAISLASAHAARNITLHIRYINELEQKGLLERALEFLPEDKILTERKLKGMGMTRPSIAVLVCYSKNIIREQILSSDLPEDPYLCNTLELAFPKPIRTTYRAAMEQHSLRREIIATQLSNTLVNEMSFTFVYRLQHETGASVAAIMRAYTIARTVFAIPTLWSQIEALDNVISTDKQVTMLMQITRMLRRATRWILQHRPMQLDITTEVSTFADGVRTLAHNLDKYLMPEQLQHRQQQIEDYNRDGIPMALARDMATIPWLFSALDIIELANQVTKSVDDVSTMYFAVGERFDLRWLRQHVLAHQVDNHWEALAREALRDDLDWQQRILTSNVLLFKTQADTVEEKLAAWFAQYEPAVSRWQHVLTDLQASMDLNLTMFFVAIRELHDVAHMCQPVSAVAKKSKKTDKRRKATS
jgi:glutamate dehydrogenase